MRPPLPLLIVSERGVAFFRDQDLTIDEQRQLATRLGELTLKPASSKLHVHPLTVHTPEFGAEVFPISSERRGAYSFGDRSRLGSVAWHTDITYEPIPSDYSVLKMHTVPTINGSVTGGDTLFAR